MQSYQLLQMENLFPLRIATVAPLTPALPKPLLSISPPMPTFMTLTSTLATKPKSSYAGWLLEIMLRLDYR